MVQTSCTKCVRKSGWQEANILQQTSSSSVNAAHTGILSQKADTMHSSSQFSHSYFSYCAIRRVEQKTGSGPYDILPSFFVMSCGLHYSMSLHFALGFDKSILQPVWLTSFDAINYIP
jgi:hypothetical protein